MTTYYKATDGVFTVFRATESRVYRSAWIQVDGFKTRPTNFGFSANIGLGMLKAVEIAKPEYEALVKAKKARTSNNAPNASWLSNIVGTNDPDLGEPEPVAPKAHEDIVFEEAAPVIHADPTKTTYMSLVDAYEHLNERLWNGRLPSCLVTLQRKANTRGYFAGERFTTRDGQRKVDEIALNPSTFKERDTRNILSTLAHEMVHLEQHHTGKPGKGGYHNREWGTMMHAIGLTPVSVDQPGKEVGSKVTHEIDAGGRFDIVCAELLDQGVKIDYVENWNDESQAKAAKKLKVKYTCGQCGANCWAKPDAHFVCGDCDEPLEAE